MTYSTGTDNPEKLYIVCDASASMLNGGKPLLVRGIARTVEQYVRLGYGSAEIKLAFWNVETRLVDWNPDDEFPIALLESAEGSSDVASLTEWFSALQNGKILLLTDCCWSNDDVQKFKLWKSKLPPDTLRVIKIGSDATLYWKDDEFFSTDEIFLALDNWFPINSAANNEEDAW